MLRIMVLLIPVCLTYALALLFVWRRSMARNEERHLRYTVRNMFLVVSAVVLLLALTKMRMMPWDRVPWIRDRMPWIRSRLPTWITWTSAPREPKRSGRSPLVYVLVAMLCLGALAVGLPFAYQQVYGEPMPIPFLTTPPGVQAEEDSQQEEEGEGDGGGTSEGGGQSQGKNPSVEVQSVQSGSPPKETAPSAAESKSDERKASQPAAPATEVEPATSDQKPSEPTTPPPSSDKPSATQSDPKSAKSAAGAKAEPTGGAPEQEKKEADGGAPSQSQSEKSEKAKDPAKTESKKGSKSKTAAGPSDVK